MLYLAFGFVWKLWRSGLLDPPASFSSFSSDWDLRKEGFMGGGERSCRSFLLDGTDNMIY